MPSTPGSRVKNRAPLGSGPTTRRGHTREARPAHDGAARLPSSWWCLDRTQAPHGTFVRVLFSVRPTLRADADFCSSPPPSCKSGKAAEVSPWGVRRAFLGSLSSGGSGRHRVFRGSGQGRFEHSTGCLWLLGCPDLTLLVLTTQDRFIPGSSFTISCCPDCPVKVRSVL
jgi:hypothetical protein